MILGVLLALGGLLHCATGVDPEGPPGASTTTTTTSSGTTGIGGAGSTSTASSSGGPTGSTGSTGAGGAAGGGGTGSQSASSTASSSAGGGGGPIADCLMNIPANCPNCDTQNASDKPKCQEYLACYIANDCDPADPCGSSPDGVCGVNTIGGGNAPKDAAIQTFQCACP